MHPLTVTWAPRPYLHPGAGEICRLDHTGFNNYLCTPNGMTHRLLTRLATENLFHPFQPFILGQKQLAPKMAAKFGIPLVFYGENEAEFGKPDCRQQLRPARRTFLCGQRLTTIFIWAASACASWRRTIRSIRPTWRFICRVRRPTSRKPHPGAVSGLLRKVAPAGRVLLQCRARRLPPTPERTQGTYLSYNSIDDKIDDFFYYTTYIKYGIGRTTYDAAQGEIRNEEITLDEGKACARSSTASTPTALRRKFSSICRWTASTSPGSASCLSSPRWTGITSWTWPIDSALPTSGSGRTVCGSCATPL